MWNESLWSNEAALKYDPTNSKAIYNAKFSLRKISPEAEWIHPYSWTERIILSIGDTSWFILMLFSSIIVALSAFFLISSKKENSKKLWSKRLIFPFIITLIIAVFCYNETLNHYEVYRYAYSVNNETQLFLSPGGLEVDETIPETIRHTVISQQTDWIEILTSDLRAFWVKKEDVFVY
jgi:hypothetical protein